MARQNIWLFVGFNALSVDVTLLVTFKGAKNTPEDHRINEK